MKFTFANSFINSGFLDVDIFNISFNPITLFPFSIIIPLFTSPSSGIVLITGNPPIILLLELFIILNPVSKVDSP